MTLKTKYTKFIAFSILGLAITGCQTLTNTYQAILPGANANTTQSSSLINYQKCPTVEVVRDLSRLSKFAKNTSTKTSNLESSVAITSSENTCTHKNKTTTVDLTLQFDGKLGDKGHFAKSDSPIHTYPFFVAITNKSGDIIGKEIFAASINYKGDSNSGSYTETIRQIIPIGKASNAKNFKISVGFQLSEEELAYNRAALEAAEEKAAKIVVTTEETKIVVE